MPATRRSTLARLVGPGVAVALTAVLALGVVTPVHAAEQAPSLVGAIPPPIASPDLEIPLPEAPEGQYDATIRCVGCGGAADGGSGVGSG